MKYLKKFNESSKESIEEICRKYRITNYIINDDNSISVNGSVYLQNKGLSELPLKFKDVSGSFYCFYNQLTSLEGCPKLVGGNFNCSDNELKYLEGAPISVDGYFSCFNNPIDKYWKGEYKDYLELYVYLNIHTDDPDKINQQKIKFIDDEISKTV